MSMTETTIRGVTYAVPTDKLQVGLQMFDLARDGLGRFKGALGRRAFLDMTGRIACTLVSETAQDPYAQKRFLKVLRAHLARSRASAGQSSAPSAGVPSLSLGEAAYG
jgi:hypothetical protein